MGKRILVGYVSRTGSTEEVARSIAKELSSKGFSAEAKSLSEPGDLAAYDGFVIGAPVNGMAWAPEALSFVQDKAAVLASKPVAYFLLSIAYGAGRPSLKAAMAARLGPPSAIVAPVATACFGGLLATDPPLVLRIAFGIKKGAPRDSRDWTAVRAFSDLLAEKFA